MRLVESKDFEDIHLAPFKRQDLGGDGVCDVWQIEEPQMLWHFRGEPPRSPLTPQPRCAGTTRPAATQPCKPSILAHGITFTPRRPKSGAAANR
jgi:hypothetical protein